jgi:CDP-diacylglycerol--glycerol-3-phosphate 3-phosphatidyltransferase
MPNSQSAGKSNLIEKSARLIFNLPNIITMARIIFVPFFIWSLVAFKNPESAWRWVSVLVFIIIMSSDGIDGAIARRRGLITNLGKLLDPIADKVLLSGALVSLSILGEVSWLVTIVILVRELGITAYRFVVIRKEVVAASSGGKLKTIFQGIMVGFVVSPLTAWFGEWYVYFEGALVFVATALTVSTGVQYMMAARRTRRQRIIQ